MKCDPDRSQRIKTAAQLLARHMRFYYCFQFIATNSPTNTRIIVYVGYQPKGKIIPKKWMGFIVESRQVSYITPAKYDKVGRRCTA